MVTLSPIVCLRIHGTDMFRPFADAVRANTGAIMCAYNQVNNSYGCQNSHILNYLLKGKSIFIVWRADVTTNI